MCIACKEHLSQDPHCIGRRQEWIVPKEICYISSNILLGRFYILILQCILFSRNICLIFKLSLVYSIDLSQILFSFTLWIDKKALWEWKPALGKSRWNIHFEEYSANKTKILYFSHFLDSFSWSKSFSDNRSIISSNSVLSFLNCSFMYL